jgi:CHASE3 domain sensor protein
LRANCKQKRKATEKLEKLNQAKEQIEAIQREIDEMKEQENRSLWQELPLQNSGPNRRTPKEIFFVGNLEIAMRYPYFSRNVTASETLGNF